ncbi:complement C1q tumor necrosis factor-related protein 7-like [Saccostrea echinata]|uniref:complement C1q tumor necrosis factor-related protein 7-like n=1 Tax=Saccostrea echinata TaxID=191078 RepID=UPI002A823781|nr:complement C1q tumor necrosis factor-related protein 7-like [Saccostrea echinata]
MKTILVLSLVCAVVSSAEITTLLKGRNITSLEERLSNLEKTIDRRLNVTEQVLGQLLTGRTGADISLLDVLSLRSGLLGSNSEPVLFSAYKSFSENGISSHVTIRFDKTYINLGDHYHTEDGIFIAPATGVYLFHWTIATAGSSFSTQLMVGGSPRASNLIPFPGGIDSASAMVIINVNEDDHVWIQLYGSSEYVYGDSFSIGNNYQSTFSGILLRRT